MSHLDHNVLFEIVSEACQNKNNLNEFQVELIVKISDFFASVDDLEFTTDATIGERCEFVLANRYHFMTYANSQNEEVFSLREIEVILNANTSERNTLINELLLEKNIPESEWSRVRFDLVTASILYFLVSGSGFQILKLGLSAPSTLISALKYLPFLAIGGL